MWRELQRDVVKALRTLGKGGFGTGKIPTGIVSPVNDWQQLPDTYVQLSVYKSFLVLVVASLYNLRNKEHLCPDPGLLH